MNKKLCTQSNKLFGLVTEALNFYLANAKAVIDGLENEESTGTSQ